MTSMALCFLIQLFLGLGMAGLFWPDKMMPLFDVLMFPWAATYRTLRANCVVAIALALVLCFRLHFGIS